MCNDVENSMLRQAMDDGLKYFIIPNKDSAVMKYNLPLEKYHIYAVDTNISKILTDKMPGKMSAKRTSSKSYELCLDGIRITEVSFGIVNGYLHYN